MLILPVGREREECRVVDQFAADEAKLAKRLSLCEDGRHWFVADLAALVEINLEDVGAMLGERENSLVGELGALVQLEL